METKVLNLDGSKNQEFVMAYAEELNLPSFHTLIDEFWLTVVNNIICDYFKSHQDILINKEFEDGKDYSISMTISNFSTSFLSGEGARFKDYVLAIIKTVRESATPSQRIYINFASMSSDHFVSAMIDDKFIILGVHMGNAQL